MRRLILILITACFAPYFLISSVSAQEHPRIQKIKAEIRRHREAIRRLRDELHKIVGAAQQEGYGEEGYGEEGYGEEGYGEEGYGEEGYGEEGYGEEVPAQETGGEEGTVHRPLPPGKRRPPHKPGIRPLRKRGLKPLHKPGVKPPLKPGHKPKLPPPGKRHPRLKNLPGRRVGPRPGPGRRVGPPKPGLKGGVKHPVRPGMKPKGLRKVPKPAPRGRHAPGRRR